MTHKERFRQSSQRNPLDKKSKSYLHAFSQSLNVCNCSLHSFAKVWKCSCVWLKHCPGHVRWKCLKNNWTERLLSSFLFLNFILFYFHTFVLEQESEVSSEMENWVKASNHCREREWKLVGWLGQPNFYIEIGESENTQVIWELASERAWVTSIIAQDGFCPHPMGGTHPIRLSKICPRGG